MITLKTEKEIELIARACEIIAEVLDRLEERVEAGVTTAQLDRWAEEWIREHEGATPASRGSTASRRPSARASTRRSCTGSPRPTGRWRRGTC